MDYDYLLAKYGPVMTLHDLADTLHRKYNGLRMSLRGHSVLYDKINATRVRMGRRVYFCTVEIAEIIRNS